MLRNPLPHNQNINSRTVESKSAFGGHQNSLNTEGGHGCINMMSTENVVMRVKDYGSSQPNLGKETTPPEVPLHIDNPFDKLEFTPHIPKGVLKHSRHNPNARATQNYSVVKDLGHTPCAMSALEVLQSCPSQRKALLFSLGVNNDKSSSVIKF